MIFINIESKSIMKMECMSIKKIRIHLSFYLFLTFILFTKSLNIIWPVFIILLIHEIGHFIFIEIMRLKIKKIHLTAIGFYIELPINNLTQSKKILIYSGGLIINIILHILIIKFNILESFKKINLFILIINLLPIQPLDGFNIYYTLLSRFYEDEFLIDVFLLIGTLIIVLLMIFFVIFKFPIFLFLSLVFTFNTLKLYKNKKINYLRKVISLFYKAN